MNDQQHMGWVALALANGVDVSAGYPWSDGGADDAICAYDGWWRCDPGYIDGAARQAIRSLSSSSRHRIT